MKTLEKDTTRLVLGGWKAGSIALSLVLPLAPFAAYFLLPLDESGVIWGSLLTAAVAVALVPRLVLWERIELDSSAGEARFDQRRPIGRLQRVAVLKPVSRVEIESIASPSNSRSRRRLVLVTGHERTPFTVLYSSARLDDEQAYLNHWLREAFGDRWREAASRMAEAARPGRDAAAPEGAVRVRHPGTGLTVDLPEDWAVTVSLDRSGPLRIFGFTLLERLDRPGEPRSLKNTEDPDKDSDWNALIARGVADTGLKLSIHDGPLEKTLAGTLDDPWSKEWGIEVLTTTPEVEIGGLMGFSIARRIPEGGSTTTFGRVAAPVRTRQVWLGTNHMHLEAVAMARLDDPELQRALDAMIGSIRLRS